MLTEEMMKAAEGLQKEKQEFIHKMVGLYPDKGVSYDDWQMSFVLIKMAALQNEIKALKARKND